jgi:hypothetical protein
MSQDYNHLKRATWECWAGPVSAIAFAAAMMVINRG